MSSIQLTDLEGLSGPMSYKMRTNDSASEPPLTQDCLVHVHYEHGPIFTNTSVWVDINAFGVSFWWFFLFSSQRKMFPISPHFFKPERIIRAMPPTYKLNNGI